MIGSVTVGWVLFICAGSVVYCVVAYSDSNEVLCTCTQTVRFSVCEEVWRVTLKRKAIKNKYEKRGVEKNELVSHHMSYVISHNDIIHIIIKSQPPIRLSYPYCLNLWRGICVNSKVGASGNIQEAAVQSIWSRGERRFIKPSLVVVQLSLFFV